MVHANDMTHWAEIGCKRGCEKHQTVEAPVDLSSPHGYHDLTPIPSRFAFRFFLEIWNTFETPVDGGPYCPARDAVSETILSHRIWEPQETAVLLECFEQTPGGLFIDFGSQVGWFSTLALFAHMNVMAFDADPECVDLTYRNLVRHAPMLASFGAHLERLGPDTAPFKIDENPQLPTVAKIDVEGAERYAVRKLQPLIDERWVRYILMEVSPVFNDSYPDIVLGLMEDGYSVYELPPKRVPPVEIDRLSALEPFELRGDRRSIATEVASWHQKDLLFVLEGIE